MPLELFPHNQQAYEAVMEMLGETGKAAVIHPTGTGKSFIAFKLCQDHPAETVCWLSPSEYIFKTQIENLKAAPGGFEPENIRFFTYARLMNLTSEELAEIVPDYIILDEFHRCGAQMWGQGVRNLLDAYPEVPVLGLSATAVRYLDNQRDMADELFEGNVASEMTLGEAIVRGILVPPKYVMSVFAYQNTLTKYEHRVRAMKNKAGKAQAEKYLDALRRALDKAEGLDEVFQQHIPEKTGKYIVFCANFEHMQEMIEKVPEWFGQIDPEAHVYSAYADDPETSREFASFKEDDSEHLKLLFCIDMLNEGVHVDDISGVILLRPTVSPIIYKQQIGRALSAGKKQNAVIFDIVLNIANLCSIDTIQEEMDAAILYYRSLGQEREIVHEQFCVTSEVRDCMEMFEGLNDSLTASWEAMFHFAKLYFEENGDLEMSKRYVTSEGYGLGAWLDTQRKVRAGKAAGNLTDGQIKKLDSIGMRWESARDLSWKRNYDRAKHYYNTNGHLRVAVSDTKEGELGRWIAQMRLCRKSGIRASYLTQARIEALDSIGMVWDVPDYLWEQNYQAVLNYHRENGNLDVPVAFVDENGIRLGAWIASLRSSRKGNGKRAELTQEQIARLDVLGMNWGGKYDAAWERSYAEACRYYHEHGNLDIPTAHVTENGISLGRWIRKQREAYATTLSEERKQKLDGIGMVWVRPDPWERKFALADRFYQENGHLRVPVDYVCDGVWLRRWLSEQVARLNGRTTQRTKSKKALSEEQVRKLGTIGIVASGS